MSNEPNYRRASDVTPDEKITTCKHLMEFNIAQLTVIKKHLDKHKWFKGIEDKNLAIVDFINSYAFVMRDIYCETCNCKNQCEVKGKL